jgi:hypothetical protein
MINQAILEGDKMNKLLLNGFYCFLTTVAMVNSVLAQQNTDSLDAHVHGLSELTIAMDAQLLEIQLISPAMNLVGFEHKASIKKDIAAVEQAESILRQQDSLFLIAGGGCKHLETSIDSDDLLEIDNHHSDHDDHDDHAKDSHKDEHHHDHKEHEQGESHSEIVASYSYSCKDSSKLSAITVSLFEQFPGIENINAMWVMLSKQGSVMLSANKSTIEFK